MGEKRMEYYISRERLYKDNFEIKLNSLRYSFYQIFDYFNKKGCFNNAFGIRKNPDSKLLAPSPEVFFLLQTRSDRIYPIDIYYGSYKEEELFTVIEILCDCIEDDPHEFFLVEDVSKMEFTQHINSVLRFYKGGYYLNPENGYIGKLPNDSLKNLLEEDISFINDKSVIDQFKSSIKMYFRFDSTLEDKKKAINELAFILEPLREQLKDLLNEEYGINKNLHDSLIFNIVNNFNIRHNNENQCKNYSLEIWYDWMIQYYSSVIITYFKLLNAKISDSKHSIMAPGLEAF